MESTRTSSRRPKSDSKSVRIATENGIGEDVTLRSLANNSPAPPESPASPPTLSFASPVVLAPLNKNRAMRSNSGKVVPRRQRRSTKVGKGEDLSRQRRIIVWEDASAAVGGGLFFSHPKFKDNSSATGSNSAGSSMQLSQSTGFLTKSMASFSSVGTVGQMLVSHIAIVSAFGAPFGEETIGLQEMSLMREPSNLNGTMRSKYDNGNGGGGGKADKNPYDFSLTGMAPSDRLSAPVALAERLLPDIASRLPFCSAAAREAYAGFTVYTDVGMRDGHLNSDGLAKAGYFGLAEIDLEALGSAMRSNDSKRIAEATSLRLSLIDCAIRQLIRRRKESWKKRREDRAIERESAANIAKQASAAASGTSNVFEDGSPLIPVTLHEPAAKANKTLKTLTFEDDDDVEDEALEKEPLAYEEIVGEVLRVTLLQTLVAFQPEQLHKVGREVAKLLMKATIESKVNDAAQKRQAMNAYKFPVDGPTRTARAPSVMQPPASTAVGDASPLLNASLGIGNLAATAMSMSQYGVLNYEVPSAESILALPISKVIDSTLQDLYNVYQRLPKLYEAELVFKKDLRTRLLFYAAMKPEITQVYTASKIDALLHKYEGSETQLERDIYAKYGPPIHPIDLFADWHEGLKAELLARERNSESAASRRQPSVQSQSYLVSKKSMGKFETEKDGSGNLVNGTNVDTDEEDEENYEEEGEDRDIEHATYSDQHSSLDGSWHSRHRSLKGSLNGSIGSGGGMKKRSSSSSPLAMARRIANRVTPLQLKMHSMANACLNTVSKLAAEDEVKRAEVARKRRELESANLKTLFDDIEAQYNQEQYNQIFQSLGIDRKTLHPKVEDPMAADDLADFMPKIGGGYSNQSFATHSATTMPPQIGNQFSVGDPFSPYSFSGSSLLSPVTRKATIDADDILLL